MSSLDDISSQDEGRIIPCSPLDYQPGSWRPAWMVPTSYLGLSALAGFLCRTRLTQSFVLLVFRRLLGMTLDCAADMSGPEEARRLLLSACAFNAIVTYGLSPTLGIWGQAMCGGYRNKEPRSGRPNLHGLGLRMVSTHQNMMEVFPLFALGAGAILSCAPPTSPSDPLLTGVLLHVLLKALVYPISYIFDWEVVRGLSHIIGNGAILSGLVTLVQRV